MKEFKVDKIAVFKQEDYPELYEYAFVTEKTRLDGFKTEHPRKIKEIVKQVIKTDKNIVVSALLPTEDESGSVVAVILDEKDDGKMYEITSQRSDGKHNYVGVKEY